MGAGSQITNFNHLNILLAFLPHLLCLYTDDYNFFGLRSSLSVKVAFPNYWSTFEVNRETLGEETII